MVRLTIFILFGVNFFVCWASPIPEEVKYTTKYDNIDVDAVIKNERLLNAYIGCLLETNSCTPDAAEFKKNLPEALSNDCKACSEAQKIGADKLSHHLIDDKPEIWDRLEEKYDQTGEYRKLYLEGKTNKPDN